MGIHKHALDRLNERFKYWYDGEFIESDLEEINRFVSYQHNIIAYDKLNTKKVFIKYNGIYMWCILSNRGNIKTVYPPKRRDYRNYRYNIKIKNIYDEIFS